MTCYGIFYRKLCFDGNERTPKSMHRIVALDIFDLADDKRAKLHRKRKLYFAERKRVTQVLMRGLEVTSATGIFYIWAIEQSISA